MSQNGKIGWTRKESRMRKEIVTRKRKLRKETFSPLSDIRKLPFSRQSSTISDVSKDHGSENHKDLLYVSKSENKDEYFLIHIHKRIYMIRMIKVYFIQFIVYYFVSLTNNL